LALGFTAAVTRVFDALQSAVVYSAALFVGIIVASVGSAAFLNPAMALGLRSWGTVYILGPLVGGVLGVNLYYLLFAPIESRFGLRALQVGRNRSTASTKTTRAASRTTKKSTAKKAPARKRSTTRSKR
jgi:hypothetical protein